MMIALHNMRQQNALQFPGSISNNFDLTISNFLVCRIPSLAAFGATGIIAVLYLTDWKVTNRYIPYYGGKFEPEEPSKEEK